MKNILAEIDNARVAFLETFYDDALVLWAEDKTFWVTK